MTFGDNFGQIGSGFFVLRLLDSRSDDDDDDNDMQKKAAGWGWGFNIDPEFFDLNEKGGNMQN